MVLTLMLLAVVGNYYVYSSIAPVADLLRSERSFSQDQIGQLTAWAALPNVFMAFIAGMIADRIGAFRAAVAFAITAALGALITARVSTFAGVATGRFVFGCGGQSLMIAVTAAAAQIFAAGQLGLSQGLITSAAAAAAIAADSSPAWAHGVYSRGSRDVLMLATYASILGLAAIVLAWRLAAATAHIHHNGDAAPARRSLWSDVASFPKPYWILVAICVLLTSIFEPYCSTFAIAYLQDAHRLARADAGLANSAVFLVLIVLAPVFGRIFDAPRRRTVGLLVGALLLLPAFPLLRLGSGGLWIPIALLALSYSLLAGVLWPSVARVVAPASVGTAYGLMSSLLCLGVVLASPAIGFLNRTLNAGAQNPSGYAGMLLTFACLSATIVILSVILRFQKQALDK